MKQGASVVVCVDGIAVEVVEGATVAAAIEHTAGGVPATYRRAVGGERRGALCGMGVCQECRVAINGCAHRLACMTRCQAGMQILTGGGGNG